MAIKDLLTLRYLTHLDIIFKDNTESVQEAGRILASIRSLQYIGNKPYGWPHKSWFVIERDDDGGYIGLGWLGYARHDYSWGGHYGGLPDARLPSKLQLLCIEVGKLTTRNANRQAEGRSYDLIFILP